MPEMNYCIVCCSNAPINENGLCDECNLEIHGCVICGNVVVLDGDVCKECSLELDNITELPF